MEQRDATEFCANDGEEWTIAIGNEPTSAKSAATISAEQVLLNDCMYVRTFQYCCRIRSSSIERARCYKITAVVTSADQCHTICTTE